MGHNVCAMLSSFIAHNVSIGRCNHKPSSLLCRLRCELLRFGRARPLAQRDRLNILKSLYIAIIAKNDRRKEKELPIRDCQLWLSVHSSSRVLFSIVQWENWLHTHTHNRINELFSGSTSTIYWCRTHRDINVQDRNMTIQCVSIMVYHKYKSNNVK